MISREANNIATIVLRHLQFICLVRSVLNYVKKFELEYGVPLI